jgi:hypothetical protein
MELVQQFFYMMNNIKLYSWNTHSYSRHQATSTFDEKFFHLSNRFIETFLGKYVKNNYSLNIFNKFPVDPNFNNITLECWDDSNIFILLNNFHDFLRDRVPLYLSAEDHDLNNIRCEMMELTKHTIYLCSLNR